MAWLFWGALRVIVFGLGLLLLFFAFGLFGDTIIGALVAGIIGAVLVYYGYYGFNSRTAPKAVGTPTAISQQQEQPDSPENIENQDVDIMKIIRQSK